MKSKINSRFLVIAGLAILLTLVCSIGIFYKLFQKEILEGLQMDAKVLRDSGVFEDGRYTGPGENISGIRVTIVDKAGRVIYDTDVDVSSMKNHKDRLEISQAFSTGEGKSIRTSATMEKNTFYYALLLKDGNVLRVAKESRNIWSVFVSSLPIMIGITFMLFVVCIFLSNVLTKNLVQPITQMAANMNHVDSIPMYKELLPFVTIIKKQHGDIISNANMRQEFTANVSHELKTPLTAISGYSELIKNGMANEGDTQRFAGEIHRNSQRLLILINDIIRLSELDGASTEVTMEKVDLYEAAKTCIQLLDLQAENSGIIVDLDGRSCIVDANRQMIEELIYNLCDNSIRYNSIGGKVVIGVYEKGDRCILAVKDNGIGISPENQKRVFERFYRVDKSRSKKSGGTGLGLAIVKHIVEKNDAVMQMESEEGIGTTIRVEFRSAKDSP